MIKKEKCTRGGHKSFVSTNDSAKLPLSLIH